MPRKRALILARFDRFEALRERILSLEEMVDSVRLPLLLITSHLEYDSDRFTPLPSVRPCSDLPSERAGPPRPRQPRGRP
jgi:hypothetical protein